ncbi:MAG: hypothetical protein KH230_09830 [Enterocloster asparagiformis]|nr:hypothetical protein [Enterocloster asparagiformis]
MENIGYIFSEPQKDIIDKKEALEKYCAKEGLDCHYHIGSGNKIISLLNCVKNDTKRIYISTAKDITRSIEEYKKIEKFLNGQGIQLINIDHNEAFVLNKACILSVDYPINCKKNYEEVEDQYIQYRGHDFPRIRYGSERTHWVDEYCHDCGAAIGECHRMGCDVEECPICHRQLIGCECY